MSYAAVKAWRQRNPEKFKEHDRQYRRLRRSWAFNMLWPAVVKAYGGRCLKCGSGKVVADHVVPLGQGGANGLSNLQPLCVPCNTSKAGKSTDYRPDRGYLIYAMLAKHPEEIAKAEIRYAQWQEARAIGRAKRGSKADVAA